MAKAKKNNDKRAHKKDKTPFQLISGFLASVGKPLFLALFNIMRLLVFFLSIIGRVTRITFTSIYAHFLNLTRSSRKIVQKRKKTFRKKPVIATSPTRIIFVYKVYEYLKIVKLKTNLLELKISSKLKKISKRIFRITPRRKRVFKIGLILPIIFMGIVSAFFYFIVIKDLPSPNVLSQREPEVSTKIYDRNGILLYKIFKDKNRTIVPLTEVPIHVRLATLAAEDAEFYDHPGFSIKGILRALTRDLGTGSLQGGSTITQQLVKNVLLTPEKTLTRKAKEIILSIQVETKFTKDKILEMYLNEVSYGGTAYGIEEASLSYFGKEVRQLTIAEAAFLAGLPKSPTTYSPFGQNSELAFLRQREVLRLMRINKFITPETEQASVAEELTFIPNKTKIKAPHFVMYIRQLLVDKYGEDVVEKGGLEVVTSLDMEIQKISEEIVRTEVEKIKNLHVGNGAALVLNPKTGEILAMVGSKNYFDTAEDGQVNVLLRQRQPGSSIKLINYAYALENGFSPASVIEDSPITYVIPGSRPYSPVNYDGQFVGRVNLRSAFAQSRNIPAVKILASYGVSKMIDQGTKMGITTWDNPSSYGLSLTLGGGAVKALDLANVYATVANEGIKPEILPILKVTNYKGKKLEENKPKMQKVLDTRVAYLITDILKDNIARSPEFGLNSYLVVKNHPEVAVKTGTSNDLRDNWTVGYNQDFLTLTWVGNNDNSPMNRIASGVTGASPIWNKIMTTLLFQRDSVDWTPPIGITRLNICKTTGALPCGECSIYSEWFLEENKPGRICINTETNDQNKNNEDKKHTPRGRILESGASTESNPD